MQQSCADLSELTTALQAEIEAAPYHVVPGCTSCELHLEGTAVIQLHRPRIGIYAEGGTHDIPAEFKTRWTDPKDDLQHVIKGGKQKSQPSATVQEIMSIVDPNAGAIVQRAASRGIEAAIEMTDGYRYSINNAWNAGEAAYRFSYICQDSMQNKDRHANGAVGQQNIAEQKKRTRKPTYDCKGSVTVKFNEETGRVEVCYKHLAIHPTVAERKAMPRPPRKARKTVQYGGQHLEGEDCVGNLQAVSNVGKKRKRDADMPAHNNAPNEVSLSLAELLRQDEKARSPLKQTPLLNPTSAHTAGVQYDLPSWNNPSPAPSQAPTQRIPHPGQHPQQLQSPYTPSQQPGSAQPQHNNRSQPFQNSQDVGFGTLVPPNHNAQQWLQPMTPQSVQQNGRQRPQEPMSYTMYVPPPEPPHVPPQGKPHVPPPVNAYSQRPSWAQI